MLEHLWLAITTLGVIIAGYWHMATRRPFNYPPGPKFLPIIGNTRELRRTAQKLKGTHLVYDKWMVDYDSPVLGLKLGSEYVVVVLNYALARAVNTGPDFEGRPDNFFLRLRTMGQRLGISFTDGEFWAEQRNFVTMHLRKAGYAREPMDVQVGQELAELLSVIADNGATPVWPGSFLAISVVNVLWAVTAGTKIGRSDPRIVRLLDLIQQRSHAFDLSGGLLNQMSWIRHIAPEWSGFNLINRFNTELHAFLMETINRHKADYSEEKAADDLIYAYIKEMREQQSRNDNTNFTELQLIMTIVDLFIAGAHSTSNSLDLALMSLALYPKVQTRLHDELKANLTASPQYADRDRMPYTEAFLHEVNRFYHVLPVVGLRRAIRQTTLGGYTIPKDTTIMISNRRVHMNAEHWGDPEVFRPERFLDENMRIVNTEQLIPFSQGKRRCLGEQLARNCMFTFLVGILQRFAIELPDATTESGAQYALPDRELLPGILLSPKPYHIVFRERVNSGE